MKTKWIRDICCFFAWELLCNDEGDWEVKVLYKLCTLCTPVKHLNGNRIFIYQYCFIIKCLNDFSAYLNSFVLFHSIILYAGLGNRYTCSNGLKRKKDV